MKNKKIIGSLVVMVFVMLVLSSIGNSRNLNNSPEMAQEEEPSRYINIDHSIYIDGNFSETVAMYPWATGKGTIFDKFTIQGINITGGQLVIKNTDYFAVQNCIISEYEKPYGHHRYSGISIGNSRFGIIERNTIINCSHGISIYDDAEDILIINNILTGSHDDPDTGLGCAILIYDAISVEISENAIINYYSGIVVYDAGKIYISNNRIQTNFGYISDTGIYFYTVSDSSIIDNDFFGCDFTGHEHDIIISSENDGLKMSSFDNCNNLTIYGNRFYDLEGNLIVPDVSNISSLNYLLFILIPVIVIVIGILALKVKIKKKK